MLFCYWNVVIYTLSDHIEISSMIKYTFHVRIVDWARV